MRFAPASLAVAAILLTLGKGARAQTVYGLPPTGTLPIPAPQAGLVFGHFESPVWLRLGRALMQSNQRVKPPLISRELRNKWQGYLTFFLLVLMVAIIIFFAIRATQSGPGN